MCETPTWHTVGNEILPHYKEKKFQKGTGKTIKELAQRVGWSNSEIYHCMKFAGKYPHVKDAINDLCDMSQTTTWHNVVHVLLFKGKQATKYPDVNQAIREVSNTLETTTWHNVVNILLYKEKREHLEQPESIEIPESAEGLPEKLYELVGGAC